MRNGRGSETRKLLLGFQVIVEDLWRNVNELECIPILTIICCGEMLFNLEESEVRNITIIHPVEEFAVF